MKRTLILKADGSQKIIEHKKKLTLEEMQEHVGGYIELTRTMSKRDMIVDEEGRLKGRPWNLMASVHAGTQIAGDALVLLNWRLS